jgi:hypothetical protein
MSFSTRGVKLNIYDMPHKIKIYLAPKEKKKKLVGHAEISLLQRETGPLERKMF